MLWEQLVLVVPMLVPVAQSQQQLLLRLAVRPPLLVVELLDVLIMLCPLKTSARRLLRFISGAWVLALIISCDAPPLANCPSIAATIQCMSTDHHVVD
jgi:hypothetical protein